MSTESERKLTLIFALKIEPFFLSWDEQNQINDQNVNFTYTY